MSHNTAIPISRDQEIFKRVEIRGERQCAIAEELGLDPSRISQIVSRVRRWLAQGGQGDAETLTALEERRLARSLAQARHEAIYALVMREAARQEQQTKHQTVRTRVVDGQEKEITTTLRDQRLNVQLLKAAQRAAIELERLAEREPIPEPAAEPASEEGYCKLLSLLGELRGEAEKAGRVSESDDFDFRIALCQYLGRDTRPWIAAQKIRRALERQESAAREESRVHESGTDAKRWSTDEMHQAAGVAPKVDPSCEQERDELVHCASLMHPTRVNSAQHQQSGLVPESAAAAAQPAAVTTSPAEVSVANETADESRKSPARAREKSSNMSPPRSGESPQKRRAGHDHDEPQRRQDDRIPIVLHAWTYRDGTPID